MRWKSWSALLHRQTASPGGRRPPARPHSTRRPQVRQFEDRVVPSVTVTGGFTGVGNTGWCPPDTNLAVGPQHVVEIVNESLVVYSKATGTKLSQQSLTSLFSGFDTNGGVFDPTVVYDEQAGRFVLEGAVKDTSTSKAFVDLAVSNSSDPTQGFGELHQIEVDGGGQYWMDNGKLGWDADAYVYAGNAYTFAGGWGHETILTIAKSTVLDQTNSTFTYYEVDRGSDFSMVPARMHGSVSGGPMWFVEGTWSGGSSLSVIRMSNVLSSSPSFTYTSLSVNAYSTAASIPQPGGTVDAGDCRVLTVEWNNSHLVATFNSAAGTDGAAAWCEFSTSGSNPVLSQQGVIHPANGISTYFAAASVDASGDIGLTYMESSATEYVSMYVTGRLATDAPGSMETPVLVAAGTVTLSPSRAGDYAGIALDPSAANTFWAANEYAPSGSNWGTWLAEFQVTTPVTTDQPPTVATPAGATPTPVTGTTTNLSVLGADDTGESSLSYTWSVSSSPTGAPVPTFTANGTNAAKNTTVTFYQAGSYTFVVTLTDPAGLTTTSTVTVVVNQTLTSIAVTPNTATVADNGTLQLTASARDQFGLAMASQPTFSWSVLAGGLGSVSSAGMYTAPSSGTGSATVSAVASSLTGTTSISVSSVPATPTGLTATAGSTSLVNLAWADSSTNVTGFTIQRSSNGGKSWSQLAQVGGSVMTFADNTVHKNQQYQYRVQAYNGVGTSAWSNVANVTTPTHNPQLINTPAPDTPTRIPGANGSDAPPNGQGQAVGLNEAHGNAADTAQSPLTSSVLTDAIGWLPGVQSASTGEDQTWFATSSDGSSSGSVDGFVPDGSVTAAGTILSRHPSTTDEADPSHATAGNNSHEGSASDLSNPLRTPLENIFEAPGLS